MKLPSYHDLHITTKTIERISIFDLPFCVTVTCSRVGGWKAWDETANTNRLIAGEYDDNGLRLDVAGHIICDSLGDDESQ